MPAADCTPMLKALSDDTRWRLVQHLLSCENASVNTLTETLRVPQPSVSKHLRILRQAGIVTSEKEGTTVRYSVVPDFRHRLANGGIELDLGCCSFKFDGTGPMRKV